jgi:hypothetical protein
MATITIHTALSSVTREKKDGSGEYTKHTHEATFETQRMRINLDFEVREPKDALKPGIYDCDIENQLVPGRFGLELPRYLKVTARQPVKA